MVYDVIKPIFVRSTSNNVYPAKVYLYYVVVNDENINTAIIFKRLTLVDFDELKFYEDFELKRKYKDKYLMELSFSIKTETFEKLFTEFGKRMNELNNK